MSILSGFIDENTKKSIRTFLGIIGIFNRFVLKFIWLPILLAIGLGYYFNKKEKEKPVFYTAEITFIESNLLSPSPLNNTASFSGISRDGGATVLSGILNSDAIISKALFTPVSEDSDELLINLYTRVYRPSFYANNRFTNGSLDSLESNKKITYKSIFNELTTNTGLLKLQSDGVKKLTAKTKDEQLSFALVNNVYNSLIEFYESTQTTSYNQNIELLERKRDSTYNILKALEMNLAQNQQRSGLRVTQVQEVPNADLIRRIALTETNYRNLYSQVETLKRRQSQNFVTYFRKLNFPMLPLSESNNPVLQQTVIGSAIGLFAGLFFIVIIFVIVQGVQFYKTLY